MTPKGNTFPFSISEVGESTNEKFNASFTAKRVLTIRDRIQKDAIRRNLIGERPQDAEPVTVMRAEMLAHLSVSISDAPKVWKEDLAGGLDLGDDNVLIAIYNAIIEGQTLAEKEAEKEGIEAKEKLRKTARSKKVEEESQKDEGSDGGAA